MSKLRSPRPSCSTTIGMTPIAPPCAKLQPLSCASYTQPNGCAKEAGMDVTRETFFETSTEELWAALTDPERLAEWFATEAELELVEGGRAAFRWGNGEERGATVEEIDEERRLALTWDDGGAVLLELEPVEDGTLLRVTESSPEFATAIAWSAQALCLAA